MSKKHTCCEEKNNNNDKSNDNNNMVKDPVCGMDVDVDKTEYHFSYKKNDYHFCSEKCLGKFEKNPDEFLKPKTPEVVAEGIIYTCPMHPEIEQIGPGSCPICGMALEPKDMIGAEEDTTELDDMTRRFWVCAALSIPVLLLVMFDHLPGKPMEDYISPTVSLWLEFALASPVMLWGAIPFFQKAWASIVSRNLNMFTLIGIGTGVAYIYSVIGAIAPDIFPDKMRDANGIVDVYFEAAAVIITLVMLGQVLELKARSQTSSAIKKLLNLAPKQARIIMPDGTEKDIDLDKVQSGDKLRVRPGEAVPVDGIILEGKTTIDQSMITGEAMPVSKVEGDKVIGATLNQSGGFVMVAEHVGKETLLSKIVHMVAEAQRSRAPIQKMADMVAGYFVPAVLVISIITAIVWGGWGPEPRLTYAIINAVAVLIIACPCALGLATPMSIMVGTGRGAEMGILIKNAESLELMEKINVLVVDKTGTLTEGRPKLASIIAADGYDKNQLLIMAASLEIGSEHPLAKAIVEGAEVGALSIMKPKEFKSITGKGVTGIVEGRQVALGNSKLMDMLNIEMGNIVKQADELRQNGETVMLLAIDSKLAGLISVADPIKKTTPDAIDTLRKDGVRIVMMTGDNEVTAKAVADKLHIDEVEADVLPERKNEVVRKLQEKGYKVAMAGDGINDAPALAQADVGIAMGTGADIAMESAEVTLVKGDLNGVVKARKLSKMTMRNIRENLFFAFIYNASGVPIAAGVLYPVFGLLLTPIIASIAMVFSSLSVIMNSLRLKKVKI